jgi:hypothetical protein
MPEMKHTPGPWRAGYASEMERAVQMLVRAEQIDGQPYVAVVPSRGIGDHSHMANARLIAAAPDYFEGVQKMLDNEQCGGSGWWEGFEMLKAAHRKAMGMEHDS